MIKQSRLEEIREYVKVLDGMDDDYELVIIHQTIIEDDHYYELGIIRDLLAIVQAVLGQETPTTEARVATMASKMEDDPELKQEFLDRAAAWRALI